MPNWSLPEFNRRAAFGEAGGRILWQPRIGCWFTDKMFAGEGIPERYRGLSLYDIYRSLGCSARLYEFNSCFVRREHPDVFPVERKLDEFQIETTIHTPVGNQVAIHKRSPSSWHQRAVKWEVATEDELRVAAWREEHGQWEWDQARYDELQRTVGDLGAPCMFMPRMNVQSLYIEKMGVENGIMAIYNWPETVEHYFRAVDESHERLIEVINASPVEIINFGENVHAQTLSPDLFVEYHLPGCQRRAEHLHRAGKFVFSHWDGDTKPLLRFARETGLDGIEAITPKPQGDVTLEEIKEALGDELYLIDGIPAVYFDPYYPIEVLEDCTRRIIEMFAPKLILGISDEISSTGDLERVRRVGEIVDEYNRSLDATP